MSRLQLNVGVFKDKHSLPEPHTTYFGSLDLAGLLLGMHKYEELEFVGLSSSKHITNEQLALAAHHRNEIPDYIDDDI